MLPKSTDASRTALLSSLIACVAAGGLQSVPARADELSDLRNAVRQLEARINALEAERAAAAKAAVETKPVAAPPGPVSPEGVATYVPPATVKSDESARSADDHHDNTRSCPA